MALTATAWAVMLAAIVLLWGAASWALYRSLTDEDRKLRLLDEQGQIDTYSPRSMRDLREWVEAHPDDPMAEDARAAYNECVETLREIDEPFYDWSQEEIDRLERI